MTPDLSARLGPMLCGRFGRAIRHLDTVDSTNLEALRWGRELPPAPEGALVVADRQTAGRGRWGRRWESRPGASLTFSLVLRPGLPRRGIDLLTTTVGVAVVEAIREVTGVDASLKWPNDVVAADRKVAGILVESQSTGGTVDLVVAGVGVNIDLRGVSLPEEIADRATSLAELGTQPVDLVEVLAAIVSWFEPLYGSLGDEAGMDEVLRLATKRSDVLGATVDIVFADGRAFTGTARSLGSNGSLVVESEGHTEEVRAGEITRVRRT